MAIAGYEYRINEGSPVNVGNVLTYTITGLNYDTTYSIQVRSYNTDGIRSQWSDAVEAATLVPEIPSDLGSLMVWAKVDTGLFQDSAMTTPADAAGDPVGAWADSSGNDRDRIQATGGNQPVIVESNGHLAVSFDGTDDYLAGATTPLTKPMTFFCLWRAAGVYASGLLGSSTNGLSVDINPSTRLPRLMKRNVSQIAAANEEIEYGEYNRLIVTYDESGAYSFYVNGVPAGSGTNNVSVTAADPTLSASSGGIFGSVLEWGVFDEVLDATACAFLDAYLVGVRGAHTIHSFSTGTGLLLKDDFTDLSNWTGTGFTIVENPAFVSFEHSPVTLTPTPDTSDSRGAREGHWMYVDGLYYTWYAGTDVTEWKIHLATSEDMTSLTKFGPIGLGLSKTNDPGDGEWAARDIGYVELRAGVWYLHMLTAAVLSLGVPMPPYESDVWTSTDPPLLDDWTFVRMEFEAGPTDFDDNSCYMGSSVKVGATYYAFYGVLSSVTGEYNIALATASAPDGPFTKLGQIIPDPIKVVPENPKVFWSATLNRWVMLTNGVGTALSGNAYFSEAIDDWSACTRADFQVRQLITSGQHIDSYAIQGVPSPLYGEDGTVIESASGSVSFSYDGFPVEYLGGLGHFDHRIMYGGLEPSRYRLETDAIGDEFEISSTVAYTDFMATFVIELHDFDPGGTLWFGFRDNYKIVFTPDAYASLQYNDVTINPGTGINIWIKNESEPDLEFRHYRVRVIAQGNHINVYVNGELQINYADVRVSTGTAITFGAADLHASIRRFAIQGGNRFTLTGLDPGAEVVAYGPGGHAAMAWGTADAEGELDLQSAHYPIERITVDGVEQVVDIYGGDVVSA